MKQQHMTAEEYRAATAHEYDRSRANRGKPFEDLLLFIHESYQQKGRAVVHKVPTEFIPLRDHTGSVCGVKVERKSCVDYLGRYGATAVAVEAKHTEDTRIRWDRVEDHQADFMDDFCIQPQAVGIVLVSFGLRRFFAVPWAAWRAGRQAWSAAAPRTRPTPTQVDSGGLLWTPPPRASVTAEELPPEWEIRPGGGLALPYLDIIDKWRPDNG